MHDLFLVTFSTGVEAMELETVEIKVEKGVVPDDVEIVVVRDVCTVEPDGIVLGRIRDPGSASAGDGFVVHVVSIQKKLKPDWNPPGFNKGWVTWDLDGWYWWENRPEYHAADLWIYPPTERVFEKQKIGSAFSKMLGFPCCDGFDARNCIWEVGQ
jgi:hypothetical protein